MAAGIAHEINQPLTRIAFGADSLLLKLINDRVIDPDILETKCQVILASVDRISRIIDHIRTFSRDQVWYTPNGLTFMPRLTMRFR